MVWRTVNLSNLGRERAKDTLSMISHMYTETNQHRSNRVDCEWAGVRIICRRCGLSSCIVISRRSRVRRQSSCTENLVGSVAEVISQEMYLASTVWSLALFMVCRYGLPLTILADAGRCSSPNAQSVSLVSLALRVSVWVARRCMGWLPTKYLW